MEAGAARKEGKNEWAARGDKESGHGLTEKPKKWRCSTMVASDGGVYGGVVAHSHTVATSAAH